MKRPFAVIGFSMLLSSLLFYNISFKASVALTIGAAVIFCLILIVKPLRNQHFLKSVLVGIIAFSLSFTVCQDDYINIISSQNETMEIHGVVCQAPTHTDYNHIYIIKPYNCSYKIRYISEENRFFEEGDIVRGTLLNDNISTIEADYLDSALSSKIYFSFFESESYKLVRTGATDDFYKAIGSLKNAFTKLTYEYLPSENGGIANAMVIGDRQGITDATMELFNYAGNSHLLVVSGMHLSIWVLGVIRLFQKNSFIRKHSATISMAVLIFYSALTGFSVSVVRAMIMAGALILGKALGRDADSLNSVGVGCAVILTANPFAAYSVSLWFTVLSTVGILILSKPLEAWALNTALGKALSRLWIFRFTISASAVSLSAGLCTLPVFVVAFDCFPWASVLTNILTGDAAMLIMVSTVLGAVFHLLGLRSFAWLCYTVSGALGEFITLCARKIGLAKWSSVSLTDTAFKSFLIAAFVFALISYLLRKKEKWLIKTTALVLVVSFVFLCLTTAAYDYNTPTVELFMAKEGSPVIHVNFKGNSVIIVTDTVSTQFIKSALNRHNQKVPEQLVILQTDDSTMTDILLFQKKFYCQNVAFCDKGISTFDLSVRNISRITLCGALKITALENPQGVELAYGDKYVLFIFALSEENVFKNSELYDTIIVYDRLSVSEELDCIKIADGETVSIKF